MHIVFFVLLLLTLAVSSRGENESNLLSSVDIIIFDHALGTSQHWDCPHVGDRAARAEEARLWQAVIPDARVKEVVAVGENRTLHTAEQYTWINEPSSAVLGMRRPDFEGNTGTALVKVLYSESKQISKDALSVMLPQLEQSKSRILEGMARTRVSLPIPSVTPVITSSFSGHRFRVPPATNYHPRVFKHPHFTTGDLVAWMALTAASRQKGHADALKLFKLMAQSLLPGFSVSLGAVQASAGRRPTRTVYLHRLFEYVPAGADLAFYFDRDRGKFLRLSTDSIVLSRPEGIVDGQQHAALVLSSSANVDASSFERHQASDSIAMRKTFCKELEKALALNIPFGATDAEAEAIGVLTIRTCAARLERDLFFETQRRVRESKPRLLTELLSRELVRLVIDYLSDDSYPVLVYTHDWLLKGGLPRIAIDSTRLYVMTDLDGLCGLSHSSANLKQSDRRCLEFGEPQWFDCVLFTSSHDGRHVSFSHLDRASTDRGKQTGRATRWLTQGSKLEGGGFKPVAFDDKGLSYGLLSRNGQRLFSHNKRENTTRVYQIEDEAGREPTASLKLELSGTPFAVSGNGNCVMVDSGGRLRIHDTAKGTSRLACRVDASLGITCALNEDGSVAAFVNGDNVLRVVEVDKIVEEKVDQPAIVSVKVPKALGKIYQMVYSESGKLHVVCNGGRVLLFDPSKRTFIPIETSQEGRHISINAAISPATDYIVILQYVDEDRLRKGSIYRTAVRSKFEKVDLRDLFGYTAS